MEDTIAQLGCPEDVPRRFECGPGFALWSTPNSGFKARIESGGRFVFEGEPNSMFTLDEVLDGLQDLLAFADAHFDKEYADQAAEQAATEELLAKQAAYDGTPPAAGPDDHYVIVMAKQIGIEGDTAFCYEKVGAAYGLVEKNFGSPSDYRRAVVDAVRVGEP